MRKIKTLAMTKQLSSPRVLCLLGGLAGILGVLMIGTSFGINAGPPLGATEEQLVSFGRQHYASILWGAWLQAVGPVLIIFFAFTIVQLAGATQRLAGWMTMFGATILMMVSLTEVIFYVSALFSNPVTMGLISNEIAHAVQHLYFIVAAPALFLPLGIVVLSSSVLPRIFGYLALILGAAFVVLGITSLHSLILSSAVTSLAAIQALWWMAGAITVMIRSRKISASIYL